VDRSLDRSLDSQLKAMQTKANGRQLVATLDALLLEYLAVNVRWVILECIVREPQKLAERTEVALSIDDPRLDYRQWQREVELMRSELAGNGRLNQPQRDQLWALARTIETKVVGRHGLSQDFEDALTGSQRATAERALVVALVRLEGLLAGAESV